MNKTPRLTTDRLILGIGTYEDYAKVYEYDFTKLRNIAGEFEFVKQDLNKIKGFVNYAEDNEHTYDWIIYLNDNPIGNIVADNYDSSRNSVELSLNLHPNYWRKGYMTETVLAVLRWLYSMGYDNVVYGYEEGNFKSKGLCEKIGFELCSIKENAWVKNGNNITNYETILSKEKFKKLYGGEITPADEESKRIK